MHRFRSIVIQSIDFNTLMTSPGLEAAACMTSTHPRDCHDGCCRLPFSKAGYLQCSSFGLWCLSKLWHTQDEQADVAWPAAGVRTALPKPAISLKEPLLASADARELAHAPGPWHHEPWHHAHAPGPWHHHQHHHHHHHKVSLPKSPGPYPGLHCCGHLGMGCSFTQIFTDAGPPLKRHAVRDIQTELRQQQL